MSCSRSEMLVLQTRWKWLMTETSLADKTALFESVVAYIAERNATTAAYLTQHHTTAREPTPLMAYRLFSDIDQYINSYTTPLVYRSVIEHLAWTRTVWMRKITDYIDLLFEAIVQVVGSLILSPDDKTTWITCMENMATVTKQIVYGSVIQATCDVSAESGDPAYPIRGTINFTQPVTDGPTTVIVDLSGFRDEVPGMKHGMHIHEGDTIDGRCMKAGSHFNPYKKLHGAPEDDERHAGDLGNIRVSSDGRVVSTTIDNQIPLYGKNNVIGRTAVVHTSEDDLGRGGFADSRTTGHAGGRIACCVIRRTYG